MYAALMMFTGGLVSVPLHYAAGALTRFVVRLGLIHRRRTARQIIGAGFGGAVVAALLLIGTTAPTTTSVLLAAFLAIGLFVGLAFAEATHRYRRAANLNS